jgi:hypothetical protein
VLQHKAVASDVTILYTNIPTQILTFPPQCLTNCSLNLDHKGTQDFADYVRCKVHCTPIWDPIIASLSSQTQSFANACDLGCYFEVTGVEEASVELEHMPSDTPLRPNAACLRAYKHTLFNEWASLDPTLTETDPLPTWFSSLYKSPEMDASEAATVLAWCLGEENPPVGLDHEIIFPKRKILAEMHSLLPPPGQATSPSAADSETIASTVTASSSSSSRMEQFPTATTNPGPVNDAVTSEPAIYSDSATSITPTTDGPTTTTTTTTTDQQIQQPQGAANDATTITNPPTINNTNKPKPKPSPTPDQTISTSTSPTNTDLTPSTTDSNTIPPAPSGDPSSAPAPDSTTNDSNNGDSSTNGDGTGDYYTDYDGLAPNSDPSSDSTDNTNNNGSSSGSGDQGQDNTNASDSNGSTDGGDSSNNNNGDSSNSNSGQNSDNNDNQDNQDDSSNDSSSDSGNDNGNSNSSDSNNEDWTVPGNYKPVIITPEYTVVQPTVQDDSSVIGAESEDLGSLLQAGGVGGNATDSTGSSGEDLAAVGGGEGTDAASALPQVAMSTSSSSRRSSIYTVVVAVTVAMAFAF